MSKDSGMSDEMQRIRAAKTLPAGSAAKQLDKRVQEMKAVLDPVVNDFVEADQGLSLQSKRGDSYFLSYGLTYICRMQVSVTGARALISITGDPAFAWSCSFAMESMDQQKVQNSVGEGLLEWYKSCFS